MKNPGFSTSGIGDDHESSVQKRNPVHHALNPKSSVASTPSYLKLEARREVPVLLEPSLRGSHNSSLRRSIDMTLLEPLGQGHSGTRKLRLLRAPLQLIRSSTGAVVFLGWHLARIAVPVLGMLARAAGILGLYTVHPGCRVVLGACSVALLPVPALKAAVPVGVRRVVLPWVGPGLGLEAAGLAMQLGLPGVWRALRFWRRMMPIYIRYFLTKQSLKNLPPAERDSRWEVRHEWGGEKVYQLVLDLGGFYVKSAQILASKAEFIPRPWVRRLETLFDNVPPRPFEEVKRSIDRELQQTHAAKAVAESGCARSLSVADVFESIQVEPLAAASIAQVHAARLRRSCSVAGESAPACAVDQRNKATVHSGEWEGADSCGASRPATESSSGHQGLDHAPENRDCGTVPRGAEGGGTAFGSSAVRCTSSVQSCGRDKGAECSCLEELEATSAFAEPGGVVVVKVQHLGMERTMGADLCNIGRVASFLRSQLPFDLTTVVKEIQCTIPLEFDFVRELSSMTRISAMLEKNGCSKIVCPRPIQSLCTQRMLVMERLYGCPFTRLIEKGRVVHGRESGLASPAGSSISSASSACCGDPNCSGHAEVEADSAVARCRAQPGHAELHDGDHQDDLIVLDRAREAVLALLEAYGIMFFVGGEFHADPHPGNLLLLGDGRLGLLDFGQCKALDKAAQIQLAQIVLALVSGDDQRISFCLLKAGFTFGTAKAPPPVADCLSSCQGLAEAAGCTDIEGLSSNMGGASASTLARMAYVLFDTRPSEDALVSPLAADSILQTTPVTSFNKSLWLVVRTMLLLRGLCFSLGMEVSVAVLWRSLAESALMTPWRTATVV